jgi:ABC transporter substrate binding protein
LGGNKEPPDFGRFFAGGVSYRNRFPPRRSQLSLTGGKECDFAWAISCNATVCWPILERQLLSSLFFIDFHRTNFSDSAGPFTSFDRVGFAIFATLREPVRPGQSLEQAAPQLGVTLLPFDIRSADELADAFAAMAANKAQALIVISSAVIYGATKRVADLALLHGLPSCHPFRETVAAGGLVSLGPDASVMAKQGADYAARIMQGSKPSDLPVEQPTRYEMHINLKTAKALGITVPATLLVRADGVIE